MSETGCIYLVPTPIGNKDDITLRAIETLKNVDAIACEDTRHSAPLLTHLGIHKPLISFHEHNEARRAPELVKDAQAGKTIAVISDAGMPGISDPGYRLVQSCIENDVPFYVLPGPSSILNALIGSGFPSHSFHFGGFLSVKKGKRLAALITAADSDSTHIFFESPHRILSTLEIFSQERPEHKVCVARELTKKFETFHRGTAQELFSYFTTHPPKGEIVLLVHPSV